MKRNYSHAFGRSVYQPNLPALRLLSWAISVCCGSAYAVDVAPTALPTGGQIAGGSGAIHQNGSQMTIQQNSQRLITNWETFNVGAEATVRFNQPSASAEALNRVNSTDPSQILGNLQANGKVLLVNPAGVVFGPNARVDVSGITASSMNISDKEFLAGQHHFVIDENKRGKVVNYGEIAAKEGGFVALVGGEVDNAGKISAPQGQVAMAAGEEVHLDIGDAGLVSVQVKGGSAAARVDNSGMIAADGGKVWLTAKSAAPALASAVNQNGTVQANTVVERNGAIYIEAGGGMAQINGAVVARGEQANDNGGKIVVTGDQVLLGEQAKLDASGEAGGGAVHVGGGWQGKDPDIAEAQTVQLAAGAEIQADAKTAGQGGTVSVWSAKRTQMDGKISARGGRQAGDGGKVETSSKGGLALAGQVDVSAPQGKGGDWLLDPYNLVVSSAASSNVTASPNFTAQNTPAVVQASSIESALNGGTTVTLSTGSSGGESGNIDINENISKTAGGNASLIFDAANNITLASGKAISSIFGNLNVDFGTTPTMTGVITLNGTVSSNGGNVNFYKPTYLGHTTPVSTKYTELGSQASGNITFYQDAYLAAPGYSVTLDASGPQSGSTYTGHGGQVEFKKSIYSAAPTTGGLPQYSQALALITTGSDMITPANGPGAIILGGTATDVIGGSGNAALKSLSLTGPTTINLKAGTINLMDTSGSGFSASSLLGTPKLILNAAATSINVKGGSRAGINGYADYVQSTFDIRVNDNSDKTLTINSDRSIKIRNRSIDSTSGGGKLDVILNPFMDSAAVGGGVLLDSAAIITNGGFINIGNSGHYAVGFAADDDGIPDGIRIVNGVLNTLASSADGAINLYGKAPTTASAGTGIKLTGAQTLLTAGRANITLDGQVDDKTNSGNKDAIILGEGGASRVTLQTSSGNISINGDASGVGINPGGGSRYDGVIISSRALLKTDSGNIDIIGKGGGGDQVYVAENHGIKLEDTGTTITSGSGNISLTGTSGGKTSATQGENSYGIYTKGNSMFIGSAPDSAIDNTGSSAINATGNITLIADSMEFVNSSTYRLQVASSGELWIKPETANRAIRFADTPGVDALVLGNDWFNGSSLAVFQPGFGGGTGYGAAGGATGAVTIGRSDGSGLLSIENSTTLRDNTTLLTGTGNIAINAPLTVQGSGSAARTLTIDTAGNVAGVGAITASDLLLLAATEGKDIALTGNNLVSNLVANVKGALAFNNAQSLGIGAASSERLNTLKSATGILTTNDDVTLTLSSGALTLNNDINVGTANLALTATTGAVNEAASAKVTSNQLYVGSQNTSTLNNANVINVLAANISQQGLIFNNTQALSIGSVPQSTLTANTDGSVTTGTLTRNGVTAVNGNVRMHLDSGDLTQAAAGDVKVAGLQAVLDNGSLTLNNTSNEIGSVAVSLPTSGKTVSIKDKDGLKVDSVTVGSTTLLGITTNKGDVTLAASADAASIAGDLELAQSVDTGFSDSANSTTVRLSAGKGVVKESGSAIVKADLLSLQATAVTAGRTSTLNNANNVNTLSANIGGTNHNLIFKNGKSLLLGSIDSNNGISATGQATLQLTAGDLTQTASGSGDIRANSLLVLADSGAVTLNNVSNDVSNLAGQLSGAGNAFSYHDANALTIASLSNTAGLTTASGGNIAIHTVNGGLTLNQSVHAQGAGNVDFRVGGSGSDLIFNGGSVTSDNGSAQAVVGRAVTTANTGVDFSANDLLLFAGAGIGTSGNKLHTDVANLAAQAGDAIWLSQVDGSRDGLNVDSVTAINGAASISGVSSTANNGSIYLDTQAGDLTLKQAVAAHGVGHVDLRAGGATSDLRFDGSNARASSGSGNVALTAGRNIVTSNLNSLDVDTLGGLRLQAGGAVASTDHRLNFNANTLAAIASSGDIWLNGLVATGLTVGQVGELNGLSSLAGLTTSAADRNLTLHNTGDLSLTHAVTASGNGNVDLRSGGHLAIDGVTVSTTGAAGQIQLVAGGDIRTNTPNGTQTELRSAGQLSMVAGGNIGTRAQQLEIADVSGMAARAGGNIAVRKLTDNDIRLQTVTGLNGYGSVSGLDADGAIWLRTQGNLHLDAMATARAAGNSALVMVADRGFYNHAGAQAVNADNGRWLIYDSNPALEDRLGGLQYRFRRLETRYDSYPEISVLELGNGYLTDAIIMVPEQYMRTFGGPIPVDGMTNNIAVSSYSTVASPALAVQVGMTSTSSAQPALGLPMTTTPPELTVPLQFVLTPGESFTAALQPWLGENFEVDAITLADGSPLPPWVKLNPANLSLEGRVPVDGDRDELAVQVYYHRKDQPQKRTLPLRFQMASVGKQHG